MRSLTLGFCDRVNRIAYEKRVSARTFWRTSDVIFGAVLLVGLALHFLIPIRLVPGLSLEVRGAFGLLLVLIGLVLVVSGKKGLEKAGQPSAPGNPTTQIVDSGIYGHSRNPMYVGLLMLQVAIGISMNSVWMVLVAVPMFLALKYLLVLPEEKYLLNAFGEHYLSYMSRVRRWL